MQTMKRAVFFFLSAALFALCARAEVLPSKVYVVANSDDPDSLAIADFYASARGIPKGNIVGLPMPKAGKISKAEYFEKIENPLVAELAKRGALKAVKLGGREPSGREIYSYVSHDIGFLVLCRGVPWGDEPVAELPRAQSSQIVFRRRERRFRALGQVRFLKKARGIFEKPALQQLFLGHDAVDSGRYSRGAARRSGARGRGGAREERD